MIFGVIVAAAGIGAVVAIRLKFQRDEPSLKPADSKASANKTAKQTVPPPNKATSPFRNTDPSVHYVGSTRCKSCHAEVHDSFSATIHRHSMFKVEPGGEPPPGFVKHSASGRGYRIEWKDGRLWKHEMQLVDDKPTLTLASYAMSYQIGSGHVARSYLVNDDGFLVQSPLTWFTKRMQWDMSPGYDQPDHASFRRVVEQGCLYCHTGRVEPIGANPFRYRILEPAIGCERCHGPGELHLKLRSDPNSVAEEIDRTIVNPRHLSPKPRRGRLQSMSFAGRLSNRPPGWPC